MIRKVETFDALETQEKIKKCREDIDWKEETVTIVQALSRVMYARKRSDFYHI